MNYNSYYPTTYNPYGQQIFQPLYSNAMQQPMMNQSTQNVQPVQQTTAPSIQPSNPSTIIWVRNNQDAAMYPVAPNNAVALWDSGSPVIYLKQADASGKPSMKIYDLVERLDESQTREQSTNIDLSAFASKADVATISGAVSTLSKDIEAIKEEMGNLASQAVKRAVGAKSKKETISDDED